MLEDKVWRILSAGSFFFIDFLLFLLDGFLYVRFYFLNDVFQLFLSLPVVCSVSSLSFVVWFATKEKAEVPPPAGREMNQKGRDK